MLDTLNRTTLTALDLLDYATPELTALTTDYGIDYDKVLPQIGARSKIEKNIHLNQKYKGKVCVWVKEKTARNGQEYHFLTFGTLKHGAIYGSFSTYQWYKEQNNSFIPTRTKPTPKPKLKPQFHSCDAKLEQDGSCNYCYSLNRFKQTKAQFDTLPVPTTPPLYLERKGISLDDLPSGFVIKQGSDYRGSFLIYELRNNEGQVVGCQKIYDQKFDNDSRNKDYVFLPKLDEDGNVSTHKNGSYTTLGKPESTSDTIYIVEGLSTGISVYMATGSPVMVALDAGNITHVVRATIANGYKNIVIAADNDIKGDDQGNAGIYSALDAAYNNRRNSNIKIAVPELDSKKVDFDDLRKEKGLDETRNQLENNFLYDEKLTLKLFHQLIIDYVPNSQLKKVVENAAWYVANQIATIHEYKKIIKPFSSSLKKRGISLNKFRTKITKNLKNRVKKINKKHAITDFSGIKKIIPDAMDFSLPKEKRESDYNNKLAEKIIGIDRGIILDSRPMGMGKTALMATITELVKHFKKDPRVTYIAHRVSLIGAAAGRLKLTHQDDVALRWGEKVEGLSVCVNSIIKHKASKVDYKYHVLFIDEIRQVLEHVWSAPVKDRLEVYEELIASINAADLVVCADADLSDKTVEWLKAHTNMPLHYIKHNKPEIDKTIIELSNHQTTVAKACIAVNKGKNIWISTDNAKKAHSFYVALVDQVGDENKDKILLLNADNKTDKRQAAFYDNHQVESKKYIAIIHTPVISSGISIEHDHFNTVFASFNNVIPANEMMQTLGRIRRAKHFFVSINTRYDLDQPYDYKDLLDGEAISRGRFLDNKLFDFHAIDDEIIEHKAELNRSLNPFNYRSEFLILAQIKGYKINKPCAEKITITGLNSMVKKELINRVVDAPSIDGKEALHLENKPALTQFETNKLNRFNVEKMASETANNENTNFHLNKNGVNVMLNNWLLIASEAQLQKMDKENLMSRDRPANLSSKALHIKVIIDKLTELGQFNATTINNVMLYLQDHHQELSANGLGDFKHISSRPISKLRGLLEKIGYELNKQSRSRTGKNARTYSIQVMPLIQQFLNNKKV